MCLVAYHAALPAAIHGSGFALNAVGIPAFFKPSGPKELIGKVGHSDETVATLHMAPDVIRVLPVGPVQLSNFGCSLDAQVGGVDEPDGGSAFGLYLFNVDRNPGQTYRLSHKPRNALQQQQGIYISGKLFVLSGVSVSSNASVCWRSYCTRIQLPLRFSMVLSGGAAIPNLFTGAWMSPAGIRATFISCVMTPAKVEV